MKVLLPLALLLTLATLSKAQDALIKPMIEAWEIDDSMQYHRAQVFYDHLHQKKDTQEYEQVLKKLYAWLEKNPDKRIEARTILYQSLGALELGYPKEPYTRLLQKAIRLAHELEDEQLTAEIYSLYAGMPSNENYLLYNLKAIEIQQRLGFSRFPFIHNRYFDISMALYLTQDYRQSIQYGKECLQFRDFDKKHWDPMVYIFQQDILGAAYKKLGKYDSSAYCYQQLLDALAPIKKDSAYINLWTGIAKGNIGYTMAIKGNYAEALPRLEAYLQYSLAYPDPTNVALACNSLGSVYYMMKNYGKARDAWRKAYQYAAQSNSLSNSIDAAKGLSDVFRFTGHTDSAFYYSDRYYAFRDTLAANLNRSRLTAMNARIAFEDLQNSLKKTQSALQDMRFTRNAILAGIVILAVIALLLYNRHRLKQQYRLQLAQRKRQFAEQEVKNAREQISGFTQHIIEKNNLIETLQQQLSDKDVYQTPEVVAESLSQYTLFTDEEWEKFKVEFAKAYPEFLNSLRLQVEQVTPAEERLAALIYLRLSNQQIANTLGISKDSVMRGKRRLKKRLNLPDPVTVEEFIYSSVAFK